MRGFLFLFDLDHFFAFIIAAIGTDMVRSAQVMTGRALRQIRAVQCQMAAAAVPPALG